MCGTGSYVCVAINIKLGFVSLLGYFVLLTSFQNCQAGREKNCNHFDTADVDESVGFADVKPLLSDSCPVLNSSFGIYSLEDEESFETPRLVVCWTKGIKRAVLQFDDTVAIDNKSPRDIRSATSCRKSNDTVVLSRHRIRRPPFTIRLRVPAISAKSYIFKVFIEARSNNGRRLPPHIQYYKFKPLYKPRIKRDTDETPLEVTDESECGKTKGCFRKGYAGCGHMNCTYFLSYNATEDQGNLELSARTTGWVAVGFSSDEYMGDDEIVMCIRKKDNPQEIEGVSYRAKSGHNTPQRMADNIVVLNQYRATGDYIYCSISVPFSQDGHQDLFNGWYRLYAYGELTNAGNPSKHDVLPIVSHKKLDLFYKSNIVTSGSTQTHISILVCLLVLGCSKLLTLL